MGQTGESDGTDGHDRILARESYGDPEYDAYYDDDLDLDLSDGAGGGRATVLLVALVLSVLFALTGVVASIVSARGDDESDDQVAAESSSDDDDPASTTSEPRTGEDTTAGQDEPAIGATADGAGDVVGCTPGVEAAFDYQPVLVEIVNGSDRLANYVLTVALLDETGTTQEELELSLFRLRAGERAIEERVGLTEAEWSTCEVVAAQRFVADPPSPDALDDITGGCLIDGIDAVGALSVTVGVTNDSAAVADYTLDVVFVDGSGTRRGGGSALVESVAPGDAVTVDVFNTVTGIDPTSVECQVVFVERVAG